MHTDVQKGAEEYTRETGQHLFLTPCTFTSLIKTFKHLFEQRVALYDTLKVKYSAGLDQLRDIEGLVFDIQERMQLKSPALVEKQRQIEDVLRDLDATTGEMEQRVKFVEEEEMALEVTKTNAHRIRDECERQFGEAIPGLKEAINGLKKLSKAEITELKAIKRPSQAVYTLL
jgi:dynein heavy chain, axonemal